MQDKLRKEVKELKVFNDITYKEISEYLEIQKNNIVMFYICKRDKNNRRI